MTTRLTTLGLDRIQAERELADAFKAARAKATELLTELAAAKARADEAENHLRIAIDNSNGWRRNSAMWKERARAAEEREQELREALDGVVQYRKARADGSPT